MVMVQEQNGFLIHEDERKAARKDGSLGRCDGCCGIEADEAG